jgi:dimethylglycine dehydrogenase
VGLSETSSFAKYQVSGGGASDWLARMFANRLPREGRLTLSPLLNDDGRLIGDFTIANEGRGRFFLFGSGIAEQYHLRWLEAHLPPSGVALRALRTELLGLAIAGPRARELLSRLTSDDVSNAAFPFLSFRPMEVAMLPVHVGRISFTGELGYEIWMPADCQLALYQAIVAAGEDLGLRHFGARALNSLRLEKSFGNWAREYRPIYTPSEAALDRFVDVSKPDFVGRDAVLRDRAEGPRRRLVTFTVDVEDADAIGDEPVWHDGSVVGWITSGGYGHCVGKSIALGYVPAALASAASGFEIEILGERRPAQIAPRPLHDPAGERMRRS